MEQVLTNTSISENTKPTKDTVLRNGVITIIGSVLTLLYNFLTTLF